jgi:hypothetical protein
MGAQKRFKTTYSWREIVIFVIVEFVVVYGVLVIFQFVSLTSYAPFVAGVAAGGASIAVNILINRRRLAGKTSCSNRE